MVANAVEVQPTTHRTHVTVQPVSLEGLAKVRLGDIFNSFLCTVCRRVTSQAPVSHFCVCSRDIHGRPHSLWTAALGTGHNTFTCGVWVDSACYMSSCSKLLAAPPLGAATVKLHRHIAGLQKGGRRKSFHSPTTSFRGYGTTFPFTCIVHSRFSPDE